MASLLQRSRRMGIALAIAFGLAVLPGLVVPLVSDELPNWLPTTQVLADESEGGGG